MPSLDALLLNSKNTASLFALNNSANTGASSASQFSFGGASSGSSQPSFGDALQSAWSPAREDTPTPSADQSSTNQSSADQETQTADQTSSWQQDQTEKSTNRSPRHTAHAHKANTDQNPDATSATPANTPSADATTPQTPPKTDSTDSTDASTNTSQNGSPDKHPHIPTADEQAAAASAQTTIAQHPVAHAAHAPTPPTTPAPADALSTKLQPKATSPSLTTDAKPAAPAQPTQSAKLDATTDADQSDPDSDLPNDPGEKEKSGLSGFQSAAKQAAKVNQQDDSTPNPTPDLKPDSPQPALSQTAQALAAAAIGNPTTALTPAADTPKSPAPAASPIALTTETSPQPTTSSSSANAAAPAQQLPQSDQDQTFEQVVMGLRGKLDPQNGRAEIHLEPPNLGTLHVSLTLTNGSLTAQFQSSSDVVRNLLTTHMEKLKTALEGQGVAVGKIAVEPPANTSAAGSEKAPAPSPSNNDGRSAGQYYRDPQQGQRRSANPGASFQPWAADASNSAPQDAPIDVVA